MPHSSDPTAPHPGARSTIATDRSRPAPQHSMRVAVIGAGHVGATFAYALLLRGLASEIVLIDANRGRAEGEAMDLAHAVPLTRRTRVWAGDYADRAGAAVTVITAGAAQRPALVDGHVGIHDVYLGVPAVVGREGVERVLRAALAADEIAGLQRSPEVLRERITELHEAGSDGAAASDTTAAEHPRPDPATEAGR